MIVPIKVYFLSIFLIVGIVIIAISEIIILIYWLYKLSHYNIEKQYGNTCKSKGFLELICYIACIMLIASATLVFYFSVICKSAFIIIPQNKLSIDLLILHSINLDIDYTVYINKKYDKTNEVKEVDETKLFAIKKEQNEFKKLNQYLLFLVDYKNKVIQKQKRESIFSNTYDDSQEREKQISKFEKLQKLSDNHSLQLFLLKNNELRDCLKKSISDKNRMFLELEYYNERFYSSEEKRIKIFNFLLNKKECNYIKNSILKNLVESIKKGNIQKIIGILENYTGQNIFNQQSKYPDNPEPDKIIFKAEIIASDIYEKFYGDNFIVAILINYLIVDLVVILLFLFKNTYLLDFILALIYILVIIVVFTFTASLSWINDLSVGRKIVIFVFFPALFCSFQTLNFKKPKKYSRFKTLNIIIFPFALIIVAYFILYILYDRKMLVSEDDNYISNFIQILIISLIYLPFIPYIKGQLTRQLSLPKD
ncbi:MAG: hypothetical protein V7K89_09080 [Nostoc sp.]|uniref:hypothetical protein n=1 Tax=Nostoc sp. TaxID=1180 RepID=UPI002FF4B3E7